MLLVPTSVFYIATIALVIVCAFIAAFLFYLIRAARVAANFASFLEIEGRRLSRRVSRLRRALALAATLFGSNTS